MNNDINQEITFRKLSVFMMFMTKGNIARTAEALDLSSVSVHRALHTLEEGINCPLFIHKGRNLVPLPAAWTLLEYCQDVTALMSKGIEEARQVAGVGCGRLRIGTLYSLTLETIPRLIMGMKLRRPALELDLTMGSNQTLLNMLEDDALDAILIATDSAELSDSAFDVIPLFHDHIFLAAPAGEKLDTSRDADLRDYADRDFVSLAEGFATYAGFQEAFQVAGFQPRIVTKVNDIFSLVSLVQAGMGFSLIPGRMKTRLSSLNLKQMWKASGSLPDFPRRGLRRGVSFPSLQRHRFRPLFSSAANAFITVYALKARARCPLCRASGSAFSRVCPRKIFFRRLLAIK